MAKLPTNLSGRELVSVLGKVGFQFQRQRGSHIVMRRADPLARVTIPDHRVLRPGTLRQILSDAGLSVEELLKLL
jgi:predicted RNA binding protein YcfA (HicA-like mRNA interferase family)